jgi:hypothetical protein
MAVTTGPTKRKNRGISDELLGIADRIQTPEVDRTSPRDANGNVSQQQLSQNFEARKQRQYNAMSPESRAGQTQAVIDEGNPQTMAEQMLRNRGADLYMKKQAAASQFQAAQNAVTKANPRIKPADASAGLMPISPASAPRAAGVPSRFDNPLPVAPGTPHSTGPYGVARPISQAAVSAGITEGILGGTVAPGGKFTPTPAYGAPTPAPVPAAPVAATGAAVSPATAGMSASAPHAPQNAGQERVANGAPLPPGVTMDAGGGYRATGASVAAATPGIADGMANNFGGYNQPSAPPTPQGAAPSISNDIGSGARDARVAQLQSGSGPAGQLYQQLLADKTPTGKRVAAQFAQDYMSAGNVDVHERAGLNAEQLRAETDLMRGREGDASATQREGIAAASRSKQGGSILDTADGPVSVIDGLATPVKTADGKRVPGKKDKNDVTPQMKITALQDIVNNESGEYAQEDVDSAKSAIAELLKEMGIDLSGKQAPAAVEH